MKFSSLFLSTVSVLAVTSSAAAASQKTLLRGEATTKSRGLQFDDFFGGLFDPSTLDLDQIIQGFMPMITQLLQSILSTQLEQTLIQEQFTQTLANVTLAEGCTGDMAISYLLGELEGLDSFQIDSVELVPESASMELSMLGFGGAAWTGVWNIVGTFAENIGLETEAQVSVDACGKYLNETAIGSIFAQNSTFGFQLGMDGSSPSIFNIADSLAESIQVSNATFGFDGLMDNIDGVFGGEDGVGIDLVTIFDGLFTNELMEQLLPAIQQLMETGLSGGLQIGK